jgi:hypothetical protein
MECCRDFFGRKFEKRPMEFWIASTGSKKEEVTNAGFQNG